MDRGRRRFFGVAAGAALLWGGLSLGARGGGSLWDRWHGLRLYLALNLVPLRDPDILTRERDGETILSSRSRGVEIVKLNATAGRIWALCDGTRGVSDIVRRLTDRFDVTPAACTRDVVSTVLALRKRGALRV
ncbi:MAG TPA: PqqD family protein [Syntrophales bacterium]|nr:PqqD family protein [Syntrophales bacterium]HPQ07456.1 PqqD family protein [Syntrophales bacterium]HRV43433.1 PqqD family protein [Syntrophales bacterium]